jgi:hypothetical protein
MSGASRRAAPDLPDGEAGQKSGNELFKEEVG